MALLWAVWEWATWPDPAALAEADPATTAFIERYKARAGEGAPLAWRPVPYARVSVHLKHAVVVSEDIDFFSHRGFALEEIRTALREALQEGKPLRGASTITQQLVKNLWLSPSRSPWRKVKEAMLTRQVERELTKRRILELYLNVVELGPGVFGAEAAARRYFGRAAADLSVGQAAALAAALPKPGSWHPDSESPVYRRRVARIIGLMERASWVRKEL